MQHRLRGLEDGQYYYPPGDLHMTVVEICHRGGRHPGRRRTLPAVDVDTAAVVWDAHGVALALTPVSRALDTLRRTVTAALAQAGVSVRPRYVPRGTHLTFVRYLTPLRRGARTWHEALACLAPVPCRWTITEGWLTSGATWYGMARRIACAGPLAFGG